MDLIIGAAGRLGGRVSALMAERSTDVVAAARSAEELPTAALRAASVRGAEVDITVAGSVDRVLSQGAETVIVTAHGRDATTRDGSRQVDLEGGHRVVEACERHGVRHLVYVSTSSASPRSPVDSFRHKAEIENRVRASSVPWTILRPTHFIEVWNDVLTRNLPSRISVPGRGAVATRWLAIDDAARAIVSVAGYPGAFGRTLAVVGPEALTLRDVARLLQAAHPDSPRIVRVPPVLLRIAALANHRTNPLFSRHVRMTLALDQATVPPPSEAEITEAAAFLPTARTTWADVLDPSVSPAPGRSAGSPRSAR